MEQSYKIFAIISFLLLLCLNSFSQRLEIPIENPENNLKLNVVYQNYEIQSTDRYGNVTHIEEDKLLLLKINDSYISNDDTGIHKASFNRYLKHCPKSLDLGLNGLDQYKSANRTRKLGKWLGYGIAGLGAYNFWKNPFGNLENNKRAYVSIGLVLGGAATQYVTKKISKKKRYKADEMVINAINTYSKECYAPSSESTQSPITDTSDDESYNGMSNENEHIDMDIIANDPGRLLITAAPSALFYMYDGPNVGVGGQMLVQFGGLFAELNAHKAYGFDTGSQDVELDLPQYKVDLDVSVPIFSKIKTNAIKYIDLGTAFGLQNTGVLKDVKEKRFVSIYAGISNYQSFNFTSLDFKDYHVSSSLLKGGLAYGLMNNNVFKINDNRYSENIRYSMQSAILYAQVVYNLKTDFNILDYNIFTIREDPSITNDIGYAIGLKYKNSGKSKRFFFGVNLELGLYPVNSDIKGFGFNVGFQYGLYKRA